MSYLEDSPAASKSRGAARKKTEKDMYIHIFISCARILCAKENGQEQIWNKKPENWLEEKGGEWRNPTGKKKENIADLRKKCDHILEILPEESRYDYLRLKKIADSSDKEAIHESLCLIHLNKSLKTFTGQITSKHPIVEKYAKEAIYQLQNICTKLTNDLALDTNSLKRPSDYYAPTHPLKKTKFANGCTDQMANTIVKSFRRILPKRPEQMFSVVPSQQTHITTSISSSHQDKTHTPVLLNRLMSSQLQAHQNGKIVELFPQQETQAISNKLTAEAQSCLHPNSSKLFQVGQISKGKEMSQLRSSSCESADEGLGDELANTPEASLGGSPSTFYDTQHVYSQVQQISPPKSSTTLQKMHDSAKEDLSNILKDDEELSEKQQDPNLINAPMKEVSFPEKTNVSDRNTKDQNGTDFQEEIFRQEEHYIILDGIRINVRYLENEIQPDFFENCEV